MKCPDKILLTYLRLLYQCHCEIYDDNDYFGDEYHKINLK